MIQIYGVAPKIFKKLSFSISQVLRGSQISFNGVITKADLVYRQYCLLPAPKHIQKIIISIPCVLLLERRQGLPRCAYTPPLLIVLPFFYCHYFSAFIFQLVAELLILAWIGFSQGEKGNQGSDGNKGEPGICDIKVCMQI